MGQVYLSSLFLTALLSQSEEVGWQLSVELVDSTGMPSAAMEALEREVEAIYASAGIRIEWLTETVVPLPEHAARVYVLERLPAMLETRLRAFRGRTVMAASFGVSGGEGSQAIYVSRSAVSATASSGAALSREAMGKALGRVVAHELAHRFISQHHSRLGILREGLLPSDLTGSGGGLHFTIEQAALLRRVSRPVAGAVSARK